MLFIIYNNSYAIYAQMRDLSIANEIRIQNIQPASRKYNYYFTIKEISNVHSCTLRIRHTHTKWWFSNCDNTFKINFILYISVSRLQHNFTTSMERRLAFDRIHFQNVSGHTHCKWIIIRIIIRTNEFYDLVKIYYICCRSLGITDWLIIAWIWNIADLHLMLSYS